MAAKLLFWIVTRQSFLSQLRPVSDLFDVLAIWSLNGIMKWLHFWGSVNGKTKVGNFLGYDAFLRPVRGGCPSDWYCWYISIGFFATRDRYRCHLLDNVRYFLIWKYGGSLQVVWFGYLRTTTKSTLGLQGELVGRLGAWARWRLFLAISTSKASAGFLCPLPQISPLMN